MKTTARVFTIIGIVANAIGIGVMAIYTIILLAAGAAANDQAAYISVAVLIPMFIVFIVLMILGIVFGTKTLKKLNTATCKSELIVWGILDLIFCNVVGGILVLCLKDSDMIQVSEPVFEQAAEEVFATATDEISEQAAEEVSEQATEEVIKQDTDNN
ncbi:MAG: hypothetical protein ACI4QI_03955 [Candidatus Coproplasma sp.]